MSVYRVCLLILVLSGWLCSDGRADDGSVIRIEPACKRIVPADATVRKVADGFSFADGPVWHPGGFLLLSDVRSNTLYKFIPGTGVSVYSEGNDHQSHGGQGAALGATGLAIDPEGHLVMCQPTARQVTRETSEHTFWPIARQYRGHRLNSPDDLVIRSDGLLYFTDPASHPASAKHDEDLALSFQGLFLLRNNDLILLDDALANPDGIALSPAEEMLYVSDLHGKQKKCYVYDVQADGSLSHKRLFFNASELSGEGVPGGLNTDKKGNVYMTGPGGILIITSKGQHIGTIAPAEQPSNLAWGGSHGKTLYMTCETGLYAIDLKARGVRNWMP